MQPDPRIAFLLNTREPKYSETRVPGASKFFGLRPIVSSNARNLTVGMWLIFNLKQRYPYFFRGAMKNY